MSYTSIVAACTGYSLFVAALAFAPQTAGSSGGHSAQPSGRPANTAPGVAAAPFKVVTELDKRIWYIFQDSQGRYWFGNSFGDGSGLFRWSGNGHTLDLFTTESGLPSNGIGRIQEDRFGNLFINTNRGVSKFDGRAFTTLTLDESRPADTQVKLGPDLLWFSCGGEEPHALYYDGTSLRRVRMPKIAGGDAHYTRYPRSKYPNLKYSPYDSYTTYTDSRGNVWFGTANLGACRFDGKTFAWMSQNELGFDEKDNASFGTRSIIEDRDGKFWITVTRNRFDIYTAADAASTELAGSLRYTKAEGLAHAKADADEHYTYIMSMAKDKAGDVWMATYGAGVWRHDGKTLTHFPVMVDGKPITLFSIYCDRAGGLWLGTHEHGVCKFNGKDFEKFKF